MPRIAFGTVEPQHIQDQETQTAWAALPPIPRSDIQAGLYNLACCFDQWSSSSDIPAASEARRLYDSFMVACLREILAPGRIGPRRERMTRAITATLPSQIVGPARARLALNIVDRCAAGFTWCNLSGTLMSWAVPYGIQGHGWTHPQCWRDHGRFGYPDFAFWDASVARKIRNDLKERIPRIAEQLGVSTRIAYRGCLYIARANAARFNAGNPSDRPRYRRFMYLRTLSNIRHETVASWLRYGNPPGWPVLCPSCGCRETECRCPPRLITIRGPDSLRWVGDTDSKLPRYVGLEIEVCGMRTPGKAGKAAARALADTVCQIGGNIGSDGSLPETGVEIRLPPLRGEDGREAISTVAGLLDQCKAYVTSQAGGHIHVDVRDLSEEQLHSILQQWTIVQDHAFAGWAPTRRNNQYCAPTREVPAKGYVKARAGQVTRYCALNIAALPQHGTLEFRLFGGAVKETTLIKRAEAVSQLIVRAAEIDSNDILLPRGTPVDRIRERNEEHWHRLVDECYRSIPEECNEAVDDSDDSEPECADYSTHCGDHDCDYCNNEYGHIEDAAEED